MKLKPFKNIFDILKSFMNKITSLKHFFESYKHYAFILGRSKYDEDVKPAPINTI